MKKETLYLRKHPEGILGEAVINGKTFSKIGIVPKEELYEKLRYAVVRSLMVAINTEKFGQEHSLWTFDYPIIDETHDD